MIARTEQQVAHLMESLAHVIEQELSGRGVLLLDRARELLSAAKRAQSIAAQIEAVTPLDFFPSTWREQRNALSSLEVRLGRIIRGIRIEPPCNHRT